MEIYIRDKKLAQRLGQRCEITFRHAVGQRSAMLVRGRDPFQHFAPDPVRILSQRRMSWIDKKIHGRPMVDNRRCHH